MTEWVDIVWRNFEKISKKIKLKSQDPKKSLFLSFELKKPFVLVFLYSGDPFLVYL